MDLSNFKCVVEQPISLEICSFFSWFTTRCANFSLFRSFCVLKINRFVSSNYKNFSNPFFIIELPLVFLESNLEIYKQKNIFDFIQTKISNLDLGEQFIENQISADDKNQNIVYLTQECPQVHLGKVLIV